MPLLGVSAAARVCAGPGEVHDLLAGHQGQCSVHRLSVSRATDAEKVEGGFTAAQGHRACTVAEIAPFEIRGTHTPSSKSMPPATDRPAWPPTFASCRPWWMTVRVGDRAPTLCGPRRLRTSARCTDRRSPGSTEHGLERGQLRGGHLEATRLGEDIAGIDVHHLRAALGSDLCVPRHRAVDR